MMMDDEACEALQAAQRLLRMLLGSAIPYRRYGHGPHGDTSASHRILLTAAEMRALEVASKATPADLARLWKESACG